MDLKEKLVEFFKSYQKEISISELVRMFKLDSKEAESVVDLLYEMELDGVIYGTENGKYMHKPDEFYLHHGVVRKSNKNKYYINANDGIINIPNSQLNGAHVNDTVYVSTKKGKKHIKQVDGEVVRVVEKTTLEQNRTFYKAVVKKDYTKNFYYVDVSGSRAYISPTDLMGAHVNDRVSVQVMGDKSAKVVSILKRSSDYRVLECRHVNDKLCWGEADNLDNIVLVNGCSDRLFNDGDRILVNYIDDKAVYVKQVESGNSFENKVKIILYNAGYPVGFSDKALREAEEISKFNILNEIPNRRDLRDLTVITINPVGAQDLDDAISLQYSNGIYTLYGHIVDVPFFVRPGMQLFKEAYLKSTSVYPANLVFPMLPEILSKGICSLNPFHDKLARTYEIKIDKEGNIIDYEIYDSVIRSNYQMTYPKVNDILDNGNVDSEYVPYVSLLKLMNDLSNILEERKVRRGAIVVNNIELDYEMDRMSKVTGVAGHNAGSGNKLIENFMLLINEVATDFAYWLQIPYMYRNHDAPDIQKIVDLRYKSMEFRKYFQTCRNVNDPETLRKILISMQKEHSEFESLYYSMQALSCMNRAYYSNTNMGHYALAHKRYGTVTSPARKFSDLVNNYSIGEVTNGRIDGLEDRLSGLSGMSEYTSKMQVIAEKVEKRVDNLLLNDYIMDLKGKYLEVEIVLIERNFICVKTEDSVYGNIYIKKGTLINKGIVVDDVTYQLGDKINVRVDKVAEGSNDIIFTMDPKSRGKALKKERR